MFLQPLVIELYLSRLGKAMVSVFISQVCLNAPSKLGFFQAPSERWVSVFVSSYLSLGGVVTGGQKEDERNSVGDPSKTSSCALERLT